MRLVIAVRSLIPLATIVRKRHPYNAINAQHRYVVQGSDTTMITIAASLFGQKENYIERIKKARRFYRRALKLYKTYLLISVKY